MLNPVDVEHRIREIANEIGRGVRICSDRYREYLDRDRDYDQSYARAYIEAGGAAHERRYIAELATADERAARDVADASYRYAKSRSEALTEELRAYQSVGASIRMQYSVAGRGEGF